MKNRGFLTSADFSRLCVDLDIGLTTGQIVWVFGQLDCDHDGRISGDDFVRGHQVFTELFIDGVMPGKTGDVTQVKSDVDGDAAWKRLLERHEVELGVLTTVR